MKTYQCCVLAAGLVTLAISPAPSQNPNTALNSNVAQSNLKKTFYPGTNFPTQFTAINASGVAVGWFKRPRENPTCNPAAFGAPCPVQSPVDDANELPYGFVYRNGQFSLFKGIFAGSRNKPIAINSQNQILFEHTAVTMQVSGIAVSKQLVYLLYDLNTGATSKVGKNGTNGKPQGTAEDYATFSTSSYSGINAKREAFGLSQIVHQSINITSKGAYPKGSAEINFEFGTPSRNRIEPITAPGDPGRFKVIDIALKECPKSDTGMSTDPTTIQFAGPNDSGMVVVSCYRQAVIVNTATGAARDFSGNNHEMFYRVAAIADDGSIAGCVGAAGSPHAFVYRNGRTIMIKGVVEPSCATGISSSGLVVGWEGDKAFTLNLAP